MLLDGEDLKKCLEPGSSPEKLWENLALLVPHLEDRLVTLETVRLPSGGPCTLAVFTASDGTPLYVLVTAEGDVRLGYADHLRHKESRQQRLDGFDPLWHGVVTVAITGRLRFLGARWDLWIIVRRAPDQTVAYHGLVACENSELVLEPAVDDWRTAASSRRWEGRDASRLPEWLWQWSFVCPPGLDPFDPPASAALDEIRRIEKSPTGDIEVVARSPGALGIAVGGEVHLTDGGPARALSVGEWVRALAMTGEAGVTRGLAGPDARSLVAFLAEAGTPVESWRQRLRDFPVALAFLPAAAGPEEKPSHWPDLLVASHRGELRRLRHVGHRRFRAAWDACWAQLGLSTAEERIEQALRAREWEDEERREAATLGVVEQVLAEVSAATAETRQHWLEQIALLFRPEERFAVLSKAVERLLADLRDLVSGTRPPALLPNGNDFTTGLLHRIYTAQSYLAMQDQIDRALRSFPALDPDRLDPALAELLRRSKINHDMVWRLPEPAPDDAKEIVRRSVFGLERWASAYLQADTLLPAGRSSVVTGLAGFAPLQGNGGRSRLIVGRDRGLQIYEVDAMGMLLPSPVEVPIERDSIRAIIPLPGAASGRLLVAGASGAIYQMAVHLDGEPLRRLTRGESREPLSPWGVACCPAGPRGLVIAVSYNERRQSTVVLWSLEGDRFREMTRFPLELPRVRFLDLATDGTDFLLAAGAVHGAPVLLHRLDAGGRPLDVQPFRVLKSGALAVRFSSPEAPESLLVGERNGLLWCADLGRASSEIDDLRWVYDLGGAVRTIEVVETGGRPAFLAGGESGRLVLLEARDGRRLWKHRVGAPIRGVRRIEGAPAGLVAVALSGGGISIFSQVDDREESLAKVGGYLASLRGGAAGAGDLWTATSEAVRALFQIGRGEDFLAVLKRFPARETRARLVRYLAQEIGPRGLAGDIAAVLRELTFRELQLLLSYLPDAVDAWDQAILKELAHHTTKKAAGDQSVWAGMAAWATCLQRLGRRSPDLATVLAACPPAEFLNTTPWVRLEYARLLLQRTAHGLSAEKRKAGALLPAVLVALLEHPLSLVGACVDVLRFGSADAGSFGALRALLGDLERGATSRVEDVERVATAMQSVPAADGALRLVSALAGLFAVYLREREEIWPLWRAAALEALRHVAAELRDLKRVDPPADLVIGRLRQCLPADLPPQDQASLDLRMSWLQQARLRLEHDHDRGVRSPGAAEHPWVPIAHGLIRAVHDVLVWILRQESSHVLSMVRPYLHLQEITLDENRRVRLHLLARPEGTRQLSDVSIVFQADGEGGLLIPGNREARLDAVCYPDRAAASDLLLTGAVRPGQETVKVRVALQDEGSYRIEEEWSFSLPKSQDRTRHRLSLSTHLPQTFRRFVDKVVAARAPVTLVTLDSELGRDAFVAEWRRQTAGLRVNLDEVLGEIGPGRRYSARALDLDLLEACAEGKEPWKDGPGTLPGSLGDDKPILICPTNQIIQRLLDGEVKGLLAAWLAALRDRSAGRRRPALVLVVTSEHACHLHALGLGKIPEIAAHRLLVEELGAGRQRSSALLAELAELVGKEASLTEEEARERIERLGWDLRLVLRWLRWLREDPARNSPALAGFLAEPDIRSLVDLELRALEPFELINVLVGTEAVSTLDLAQVGIGHVAAEDYLSTTRRSAPKVIQKAGSLFTERSLSNLRSDLQPPNKIRLEGIGVQGTVEAHRTALLSLASHYRREQREAALRRLAARGLGAYVVPVFRTGSPYREVIRGLYDAAIHQAEAKRDAAVYAKLLGENRSPLESLSIAELSRLDREELKKLLPGLQSADLQRLQRIGRLWEVPAEPEEVRGAILSLFHPETVTRLTPGKLAWADPLARLPWPVFTVGEPGEGEGMIPADELVVWIAADQRVHLRDIGEAADRAVRLQQEHEKQLQSQTADGEGETPAKAFVAFRSLRVTALGPGADALPYDDTRRVAVLRSFDLCQAAWEGQIREGVRRRTRPQMRMTALSPFQTSGALPAGSPLFVGREDELAYIKSRIRSTSILIVGSRRVGKTSLLNQIDHWAHNEGDLAPIFVDLQGCESAEDFLLRLRRSVARLALPAGAGENLDSVVEAVRRTGKQPIFLLNEIDGLVEKESAFVASWRGFNDRQARFLMVGYSAIGTLGDPQSPFFHFTEGPGFLDKTLVLTALSPEAGARLLDLLETSELRVEWASRDDRKQAYRLCLDRSYRIPWVLQRYGQLLVEHLESERRTRLTYQDVERVVERQGQVVWQYIEGIDYKSLGGGVTSAQKPGFQLILASVARRKYFLGGKPAPIQDQQRLVDRAALDEELSFTVGEAREIVKETVHQLLTERREQAFLEKWFDALDLDRALRLLTLTLMLEPDPREDGRYGFLLHILPRELFRQYGKDDPRLDHLIARKAVEFMGYMDERQES